MRAIHRAIATATAFLVILPGRGHAEDPPSNVEFCEELASSVANGAAWIVIADISSTENKAHANKIYSFPTCSRDGTVQELFRKLAGLSDHKPGRHRGDEKSNEVTTFLTDSARNLAAASTMRWISVKGQSVITLVFHDNDVDAKIVYSETERIARIQTDLTSLISVLPTLAGRDPEAPKGPAYTIKGYALELTRAKLQIALTAKSQKKEDGEADATSPAARPTRIVDSSRAPAPPKPAPKTAAAVAKPDAEQPSDTKMTLTTGPAEHLFLSANASSTDAKQVTYDDANKSLGFAKNPKQFLIGANYSLGDLYADYGTSELARVWNSVYVGLLVEASSQPFRQIAIVGGIRHLPLIGDFLSLDTVSPFAGVVWVKNDSLAMGTGGPLVTSKYAKGKAIVGLSLNIAAAATWLQPAKEEKGKEK